MKKQAIFIGTGMGGDMGQTCLIMWRSPLRLLSGGRGEGVFSVRVEMKQSWASWKQSWDLEIIKIRGGAPLHVCGVHVSPVCDYPLLHSFSFLLPMTSSCSVPGLPWHQFLPIISVTWKFPPSTLLNTVCGLDIGILGQH